MSFLKTDINKDIAQIQTKIDYYESETEDLLKETGQYVMFLGVMGGLVALPFINVMVQKIPEAIMMASKFIP